MTPRTHRPRTPLLRAALAASGVAAAGLTALAPAPVQAAPAATPAAVRVVPRAETNPLAGRTWGVYKGKGDQAWEPFTRATGVTKRLLGAIALRPKAKWFGDWIPNGEIYDKVSKYVRSSQAGDPDALVQLALFRMAPWEGEACDRLPTVAERRSYRDWINKTARAIGSAHTAVILQPDGPFALCVPHGSLVPSKLIAYASKTLSALPNTSVYIDGGAGDWPANGRQGGVDAAVRFLVADGIQYARGVALNSTHYSATSIEVERGAAIVEALAERGITGKKVVVNTSSNGKPFEFGKYDGPDAENARVCRSALDPKLCVTLGIPPTADVDNPAWGLDARTVDLARQHVDGYLWFGRPWLYKQADPYVKARALGLVRSWPYRPAVSLTPPGTGLGGLLQ